MTGPEVTDPFVQSHRQLVAQHAVISQALSAWTERWPDLALWSVEVSSRTTLYADLMEGGLAELARWADALEVTGGDRVRLVVGQNALFADGTLDGHPVAVALHVRTEVADLIGDPEERRWTRADLDTAVAAHTASPADTEGGVR